MEECELCNAINEKYRLIKRTKNCFCIVTKAPLKEGHIMILPIRHVETFSDLTPEEAKEIFVLMDEIGNIIKSKFGEDIITHINKGKHSTQNHIHIHIVPSKGGLRELVSNLENIPLREDKSEEEMKKIKDKITR